PDVIISAYTDTNAACILSNMLSCHKVPVIVSEHASLFEHWSDKSWAKKKLLEFYVSKLYKLSSLVVCVSNGLTEQVSNLIGSDERVITIYNPLRYSEFSYGKYDAENRVKPITLLAVGRVSVPKDFKTLLRAVKIVSSSYDIELKIVGGIFCQEEYRRLVVLLQDLRMEKIVKFEGYHSDVSNFYKTSDILVMSSAWEGFGNVIIESMSFGLPIVSTDCNFGPREILNGGKLGRLVPVGDHEELAKAIISEINQPLVSKEEIINRAKDFSETKIVDKYYKAIEYVCKNK
ncbi:glycosyltransferase, partial [Vibrio anguillarum]